MRKAAKIKRLSLAAAAISALLIVAIVSAVIYESQMQLLQLLSKTDKHLILNVEGTCSKTECSLHIWSDKTGSDISLSDGGISSGSQAVIDGACAWAVAIANDNSFHYGYTSPDRSIDAHHNGCYFCGTNKTTGGRSKKGVTDYEKTYCCNPFVHAAFAHGGGEPEMLKICKSGTSYDFTAGRGYDTSPLFKKLGHPPLSELQKGDVICKNGGHVMLYIGDGKVAEAATGDDNIKGSKKWNESIRVSTLTDSRYKRFERVYRYIGSGGGTMNIPSGTASIVSGSGFPDIDFTVSSEKASFSRFELIKSGISGGSEEGSLNAALTVSKEDSGFKITGTLFGGILSLSGSITDGKLSGRGYLNRELSEAEDSSDVRMKKGKATYVGTDDTDTEHSRKVLQQTGKWSDSHSPFYNGYGGWCEKWCSDVYHSAGLTYNGACCAYSHAVKTANKKGRIPKGAIIFSGIKPDGTFYENGHRQRAWCSYCGHWAGHVAIYVGNGLVAGSQVPYLMSVDAWIDSYGYGGWAYN